VTINNYYLVSCQVLILDSAKIHCFFKSNK